MADFSWKSWIHTQIQNILYKSLKVAVMEAALRVL